MEPRNPNQNFPWTWLGSTWSRLVYARNNQNTISRSSVVEQVHRGSSSCLLVTSLSRPVFCCFPYKASCLANVLKKIIFLYMATFLIMMQYYWQWKYNNNDNNNASCNWPMWQYNAHSSLSISFFPLSRCTSSLQQNIKLLQIFPHPGTYLLEKYFFEYFQNILFR